MLQRYQPLDLIERLRSLRSQEFTGLICFRSRPSSSSSDSESCFVSFLSGEINYVGTVAPTIDAIADELAEALDQPFFAMGFRIAREQCKGSSSVREVLLRVTSIRIVTWEKIERAMQSQAASLLKQIAKAPGVMTFESDGGSDLCFGDDGHCLNWAALQQALDDELGDSSRRLQSSSGSDDSKPHDSGLDDSRPDANGSDASGLDASRSDDNGLDANGLDASGPGKSTASPLGHGDLDALKLNARDPQAADVASSQPVSAETQVQAVEDMMEPPLNHQEPAQAADRPTVLSVDDSPIVQKMIQRALGSTCNLLLADNALLALQMLKENNDIALVLLDVNMPGVSGLDFCRTLRGIPKFRQLPVIMLTANEGRVSKAMGQIAGSTLYLNKPVDGPKLVSVVQQYTQNRGGNAINPDPALSA